ncbi:nuclear transport factor 2 family protein [Mucilaginibacter sp. AW1-3]
MMMTTQSDQDSIAKSMVLSFIAALNKEDFEAARKFMAPDMKFEGVMGSRDSADAYIADMQRMKFKYDIRKIFADGGDVCLFYDINMGAATLFCSGWYKVAEQKITWFKVVFDPRPLLEKQDKN